jgi:hypothetical protein
MAGLSGAAGGAARGTGAGAGAAAGASGFGAGFCSSVAQPATSAALQIAPNNAAFVLIGSPPFGLADGPI